MGYFIDTVRALTTTLRNVFRKPVTVEFPMVIRPRTDRYRASFALPDDEHGELACVHRLDPGRALRPRAGEA